MSKEEIEINERKAYYARLQNYCTFSMQKDRESDFIEATAWSNGEGFDVHICSGVERENFKLTFGQFYALVDLVKKIEENS